MGIFSKKRKDGKLVKGGDPMMHIMPYVMKGRNESAVYYRKSICIEPIQQYIRERRRAGSRITLFNIIVTSILHILHQRPQLNRFVAGRRLYEHNNIEVLYVVKTLLTDTGTESIAKVELKETDTLDQVARRMRDHITEIKEQMEKIDDFLIRHFSRAPRWFLRFFLSILRWLDFHGILPKALTDIIPLYSSVFISHLGSIGADAPFHHLYEFGTTSIFLTIGRAYDAPYKNLQGELEWRKTIDLSFTIDERICDGYYSDQEPPAV